MLSSRKEVKFCRNSVLLIDCYDSAQFHCRGAMHVKGLNPTAVNTDKRENKRCRTYAPWKHILAKTLFILRVKSGIYF